MLSTSSWKTYDQYNIQGNSISPSDSFRDLGVPIDDKLKFHAHTTSVTAKAHYILPLLTNPFILKIIIC